MKKIGITGSLASGKSTASRILSYRKGPLFSADKAVKKLYAKKSFKDLLSKKLKIKNPNLKNYIKKRILTDRPFLKKVEKAIHPLVRKEMKLFIKKNQDKKFTFFEIPLLVESKLMKNFDVILFIKSQKAVRLKRFRSKGGEEKVFHSLNKNQMTDIKKAKFCDYVVVNDKNIKF